MTLNKEDYEYLQTLEYHLSTAMNSNYCRINAKGALGKLAAIYERATGSASRIIGGCSRCILSDIKRLASIYFNDKEEVSKQKPEEEMPVEAKTSPIDLIDENCGTTISKKVEKPAAKKKTTKNKKK